MSMLKIEDAVYENIDGKVVAVEQELVKMEPDSEGVVPTIKVIPLIDEEYSDFINLVNDKDETKKKENELKLLQMIIDQVEEPKFKLDELKILRRSYMESITLTLLKVSGLDLSKVETADAKKE